jgi:hypothetical protein
LHQQLGRTEWLKQIDYSSPKFNPVKLDGRDGIFSFARIVHEESNNEDFAYVAYVNNDTKAATDSPGLMLYVLRNSARAKGTPVTKSELKDMAEKIAASIKRRP